MKTGLLQILLDTEENKINLQAAANRPLSQQDKHTAIHQSSKSQQTGWGVMEKINKFDSVAVIQFSTCEYVCVLK